MELNGAVVWWRDVLPGDDTLAVSGVLTGGHVLVGGDVLASDVLMGDDDGLTLSMLTPS